MPINYANGKIYKLVNNIDDKIYIGSTVNPLYKRKGQHKSTSILKPNIKLYQYLNEIGWDNVDIILIENFPCESKEVLHQRERYWIDILKPESRDQIEYWLLFGGIDEDKLEKILKNIGLRIEFSKFMEIYKDATSERYHFYYYIITAFIKRY